MKYMALFLFLFFLPVLSNLNPAHAQEKAYIETFSPQGMVKGVRQVTVRFSEQMIPFGDPRLAESFDIKCPEKGQARWANSKNWVYDFDKDLPAGIVCEFTLKPDLKTLSGKMIGGQQRFSFSTGGPAIKNSDPSQGSLSIDENQIFILMLDVEATEESILSNVSCSIGGINERVMVKVLKGEEKERILRLSRYKHYRDMPHLFIQCKQSFPTDSKVNLIWGKGISSLSGVKTTEDQILPFKVRLPFTALFSCERENPKADCIPILPMRLKFSSPISWDIAKNIVMRSENKAYKSEKISARGYGVAEEGEDVIPIDENFIYGINLKGPFPEKTSFIIEIPKDIKDDAGRYLANKDKFPLTVRTDSYPPLAKFSARFGIIELKGNATLPVTLRNLEPGVRTRMLKVGEKKGDVFEKAKEGFLEKTVEVGEIVNPILPGPVKEKGKDVVDGLKGRLHKIRMDKEGRIIEWLKRVASAERKTSILRSEGDIKEFSIPKPGGSKAFEVIGLPLKESGFYVVELESEILGASLLGENKAMYVPTAALVTNLSAHFKWGRESSLVWVTTLDKAEPVKDASVLIRDCNGKLIWEGRTDENGIARIKTQLPSEQDLPHCSVGINYGEASHSLNGIGWGLFVFAKTTDDITFSHSSWDNGIEPWRYNLLEASYLGPVIAHTIMDRSLLRAGETVHMKHIIRKHTMSGFSLINEKELPKAILIYHMGSNQRYEFPLKWDGKGVAETTWKIPTDTKLGNYEIVLLKKATEKPKAKTSIGGHEVGDEEYFYPDGWPSGSFRVEEFRVPLMKAIIQSPKDPLVNAREFDIDLLIIYLTGGGAGNLPVKLRSQMLPRYVRFDDYEDFIFSNGNVKEEIVRRVDYGEVEEERARVRPKIQTSELILDKSGSSRKKIKDLPTITSPQDILTELEFKDPNGEIQTVSQRVPLWPSKLLIGIKPDSWTASKESFKFHVITLDLTGKPVPNKEIKVELFQRRYYSHRKRLVGGFYSYEHVTETRRVGYLCGGKTDPKGLLICEVQSPVSGNVILQAQTADDAGNISVAHRDVWVAGKGEWWFDVSDSDRIDLLPERKRYEPGEIAKFQVRMPFRDATALVTVEREGIIETFIKRLSGKMPVIELPVKKNYSPNVFVSALVVRGRVADVQPAATVDLGKPAYKLGISEINVGWKTYELKVNVSSDKSVYKIREKAYVKVKVKRSNGNLPPKGSEFTIAVVDEGLLELMPNMSWQLLEAMMGRRGYEVKTSTAQMQVVGKRHYGIKALPQAGGGGRQLTRELFDTLLLWKARVQLDEKGEASVEIPLNDSLTSFRIVAVANGGVGLFGSGHTSIRTTQDLMMLSGIPPLVREGDKFKAGFTIRNASSRKMDAEVRAKVKDYEEKELEVINESLSEGEAKEFGWEINVPYGIETLNWEIVAREIISSQGYKIEGKNPPSPPFSKGGMGGFVKYGNAEDSLRVKQKVVEAVPTRTFQATITQVVDTYSLDVEKPEDAISGKGGINLSFRQKLSNGLGGIIWYMKRYPYTCMEQKVSRAIALRDQALWKTVISELPSHLDSDGLVKYFPSMPLGSDTLTSYIQSIAHEAGWEIPEYIEEKMKNGLKGFIEGRVIRYSSLPTADLSIRKMAALEALSRSGNAEPKLLDSITLEPNLWPTSAVIDWMNVLIRVKDIPDRDKRLKEAEKILRSRLNFQGTIMGFSTEGMDNLWWLMVSADVNAVKSILTFLNLDKWNEDMPRIVRGAIGRQYRGAWNTTTANAWGVLAMEKFSKKFENIPVSGVTSGRIQEKSKSINWAKSSEGGSVSFDWPKGKDTFYISHQGTGKPWATIQSLVAIPLKEPFSSGYKIKKTLIPIEQKVKGKWNRGDIIRVKLELEAQTDMTWVVVSDPIPAGSNILGTGLGRDSQVLIGDEERKGWVWPAFEERSFEAYRAYYEFVPKGKWNVEYTVRLNNGGTFHLPPTRVEALYSPEMFGEVPNKRMEIE